LPKSPVWVYLPLYYKNAIIGKYRTRFTWVKGMNIYHYIMTLFCSKYWLHNIWSNTYQVIIKIRKKTELRPKCHFPNGVDVKDRTRVSPVIREITYHNTTTTLFCSKYWSHNICRNTYRVIIKIGKKLTGGQNFILKRRRCWVLNLGH